MGCVEFDAESEDEILSMGDLADEGSSVIQPALVKQNITGYSHQSPVLLSYGNSF